MNGSLLAPGRVAPFPRAVRRAAAGLAAGAALLLPGCRPAPAARSVPPPFAPQAAEMLEGPERDRWQQPDALVSKLRIRRGSTVADIGSGTGYLLPYLSRAVRPGGTVYAEEIQDSFLAPLERRKQQLGNILVIHGAADDPRLPRGSVDVFVMLTVYHEVGRPVALLRALRRAGRPGARLAIIDFDPDLPGDPPPPPKHSVRERDVIAEAREAGWALAERHRVVPSQFFLVFR